MTRKRLAQSELADYIPKDCRGPIEVHSEYAAVVKRLAAVLSPELIFRWFASDKRSTGGKVYFPYFRVDTTIASGDTLLDLLEGHLLTAKEAIEADQKISEYAARSILWVEVGWGGLANLAASPASLNWTMSMRHWTNETERAAQIMKYGRRNYDHFLRHFVQYRDKQGIIDDVFSQLGLESWLSKWRQR